MHRARYPLYQTLLAAALVLGGCADTDNTFIDLSWLWPECQECEVCPDCNNSVDGYITDITDRIDVNSVQLNHYINQVKVEENFAELVDDNGHIKTRNTITLPEYTGQPIEHVLIIKFTQVK